MKQVFRTEQAGYIEIVVATEKVMDISDQFLWVAFEHLDDHVFTVYFTIY